MMCHQKPPVAQQQKKTRQRLGSPEPQAWTDTSGVIASATARYTFVMTTMFKSSVHGVAQLQLHPARALCYVVDTKVLDCLGWLTGKRAYTRGSVHRAGAAEDRLPMSSRLSR